MFWAAFENSDTNTAENVVHSTVAKRKCLVISGLLHAYLRIYLLHAYLGIYLLHAYLGIYLLHGAGRI